MIPVRVSQFSVSYYRKHTGALVLEEQQRHLVALFSQYCTKVCSPSAETKMFNDRDMLSKALISDKVSSLKKRLQDNRLVVTPSTAEMVSDGKITKTKELILNYVMSNFC